MEDRLYQDAIEITRRDEIIAKNQAVERHLEKERERRRIARGDDRAAAAAAPGMIDAIPKP
eukprot:1395976-Amphidinium_carterae.1